MESKTARKNVIPWTHPARNMAGSNKGWDKFTKSLPLGHLQAKALWLFHGIPNHNPQRLGVLRMCHSMPMPLLGIHWWWGQGDRPFAESRTAPDVLMARIMPCMAGPRCGVRPFHFHPPSAYLHPSKHARCMPAPCKAAAEPRGACARNPSSGTRACGAAQCRGGTGFGGHTGKYSG